MFLLVMTSAVHYAAAAFGVRAQARTALACASVVCYASAQGKALGKAPIATFLTAEDGDPAGPCTETVMLACSVANLLVSIVRFEPAGAFVVFMYDTCYASHSYS